MLFLPRPPSQKTRNVFSAPTPERLAHDKCFLFRPPVLAPHTVFGISHAHAQAGKDTLAREGHSSCFSAPNAALIRCFARERKIPTAKLAVGDKVKDSAVPPRLTRHRCRTHSSTANTVRLLTRALRPRLLVAFRLGPPGPILSGSVSVGITPPPTLSESVTRFLPVNGFQVVFMLSPHFSRVNGF